MTSKILLNFNSDNCGLKAGNVTMAEVKDLAKYYLKCYPVNKLLRDVFSNATLAEVCVALA